MDQQQLAILQNLESIWQILNQGTELEKKAGTFIFIAFRLLKTFWLGIKQKTNWSVSNQLDKIEYFLENIAEF